MVLYYVQLETRTHIYSYEVFTKDYDYIDLAKKHLAGVIGEDAAQQAWKGGSGRQGFDPDRTETLVTLTHTTGGDA